MLALLFHCFFIFVMVLEFSFPAVCSAFSHRAAFTFDKLFFSAVISI
jgi:hypothetical protein